LLNAGFADVTCIDISPLLCDRLRASYADAGLRVLCGDFFAHTATYDLIVEQTFFCALNPSLRNHYAAHMHRLLKPGGKLAGLLFSCVFEKEGPPFGGSAEEYKVCFEPYFEFKVFEPCYNSIPQRAGNELFVVLNKRD
jgi:SAM-dependent methyltransferase